MENINTDINSYKYWIKLNELPNYVKQKYKNNETVSLREITNFEIRNGFTLPNQLSYFLTNISKNFPNKNDSLLSEIEILNQDNKIIDKKFNFNVNNRYLKSDIKGCIKISDDYYLIFNGECENLVFTLVKNQIIPYGSFFDYIVENICK